MSMTEYVDTSNLEGLGDLDTVCRMIENELGGGIHINVKSWNDLRTLIDRLIIFPAKAEDEKIDFFKTKADKIIYSLVELDGKNRQKQLGVTPLHYKKKDIASKWKKELSKYLHEDICKHPKSKDAWNKMEQMYKEMIGNV
ncbi:hypothetical protein [Gluconacetobacter diazotrophicus]|uniref:hypothetical protein n=1 Tax=Gluconacetobacter diazotrophicus TaxID=33996 RepID=UPI0011A62AFB|nr:hypothetical protein [Gluconacetobacter diazotrophicus]